jgi:hypothetical protein
MQKSNQICERFEQGLAKCSFYRVIFFIVRISIKLNDEIEYNTYQQEAA